MTLLPSRPGSKAAEMTNEKIPEPGPARDRMVAEVVGWKWDEAEARGFKGPWRSPSTNDADALAALEAWRLADPEGRWYRIESGMAAVAVALCDLGRGVWTERAPTLPSAATAALIAASPLGDGFADPSTTREGT